MMLNNPGSVERDNQNALRKFPFSDSASCTNGACTIVPGAIVDAQLYVPGRNPGRVWLSSVGTDGKLRFSDDSGEFAETDLPITANTAVTVTFTGDGGPLPGGVIVFGREADTAALSTLGGQSFTADQTELVPSTVAWPGLPGVTGFLLDDGHVVFGDVKIRGTNGCEVSTYVGRDNKKRLRISAVGKKVEDIEATGYITKIVAESDNTNFVVSGTRSAYTVDIMATGVRTIQNESLNADQEDVCSVVKKSRRTALSESGTQGTECGKNICRETPVPAHKITLMDGLDVMGSPLVVYEDEALQPLDSAYIPSASKHPGKRFLGYFDRNPDSESFVGMRLYYRFDGSAMGRFTETTDVTLYAHWIDGSSRVIVTFDGYGTLHLAAPDALAYENPISISGVENPIPTVSEIPEDTLKKGGAEALSEIIMSPTVPSGTVVIGIRGLDKAYSS